MSDLAMSARLPEERPQAEYRYVHFRASTILNDVRFSSDALRPGQRLSNFTLTTTDGDEVSIRDFANGRPLVLVPGSVTCPLTISTLPALQEWSSRYGDRVAFALVYTREAHPGEHIGQPETLDEKTAHACLLTEVHDVDWPVLVDDLEGSVHRALDTKQNSVHIVDADGRLLFRALFAGKESVEKALESVADGKPPRSSQFGGRLSGPMKSIGYIDETLSLAGPRASREVLVAMPPMALMASVSRLLPFVPKDLRGWASVAVMASGAAGLWWLTRLVHS